MKNKYIKGLSTLLILFAGLAVILISFVIFNLLRREKEETTRPVVTEVMIEEGETDETADTAEISDSDEIDVIEQELDDTIERSFDADFEELDEEATSL
jgi:hypothetical protein